MVGRSGSAGLGTEATTTDPNPTEDTDGQETASEVDGAATQNKRVMSAAETLALSVFGFVHSANNARTCSREVTHRSRQPRYSTRKPLRDLYHPNTQ